MFRITVKGPNRVDVEFSGKLDRDDMKAALDELLTKTKDIRNGRMLYRVCDFELPTLSAFVVKFSRLPEMFRLIRNFDRAAVLADKKWLQTVSEIEGALIPGLEIKGFDPDQEAQAEAWLAEG